MFEDAHFYCLTVDEIFKDVGIQSVIEPGLNKDIRVSLVRGCYHDVAKMDG